MVDIFCDGSGSKADTPIGYSCVVVKDDEVIDTLAFGERSGTSSTAELNAFIISLEYLKDRNLEGRIFTDSQYVHKGVNEWLEIWKLKSFVLVKNDDFWRKINRLLFRDKVNVRVKWIKGHQKDFTKYGVLYNSLADKLAGEQRSEIIKSLKKQKWK